MERLLSREYALVTGATGGMGEELCRGLARAGYNLAITGRNREKLALQAKRLRRAYGVRVETLPEDLADPQAPQRLYDTLLESGIAVSILVNNAGFGLGGRFIQNDPRKQEEMLQVNMAVPTRLCRLLLPDMIFRGHGRILNVASLGGFMPGPMNSVYCATKAYLLSLSQALAEEAEPFGITVTAVCPGATRTNFAKRAGMETSLLFNSCVLTPREVAKSALRAMIQGKRVVVVGGVNRCMEGLARVAPRRLTTRLSGLIQRSM